MCVGRQELSRCSQRARGCRWTAWITVVSVNVIIWGAILTFIVSFHIPRDTNGSGSTDQNNSMEGGTDNITSDNDTVIATMEQLNCSEDFYFDESLKVCLPECGKWAIYPQRLGTTLRTLVTLSMVVGIICGTVVLLLSCVNCRKTFVFPSILVRYGTASVMIFNISVLIGRTSPNELFCSSRNLIVSLTNPARFCTYIGVISQYIYWQVMLWWFIHIAIILWGVKCSFQAHKFEVTGKNKYIHITAVIIGLVLPWLPTALVLGLGSHTFENVPPLICVPGTVLTGFYFNILPIILIEATGTSLLTAVLFTISKKRQSKAEEKHIQKVELKILLVLCYWIVTGMFTFLIIAMRFWRKLRPAEEFAVYFGCESRGIPDTPCDRSAIDDNILNQALYDGVLMIYGTYPAVNLLYAVNIADIRQKWNDYRSYFSSSVKL